ncbi:MAG TPA: prenyltransferase/squalene oxidase repeat-containing protein [Acidimicrobiales bacterium]|nr:prenyltransferase/squalene oxidase repeat-containing protein [Acidimicrobiales bacterium]
MTGVVGAVLGALALVATLAPAPPAAAAAFDPALAAAFLRSQQQPDGGFETQGFPGFETPDAVLALAEASQTGPGWNGNAARVAVAAVVRNGKSPLDYLDDLAETTTSAGQAAKLIVLDAAPLSIPPTQFDPQGDGAVNLMAKMEGGRRADGSFGSPGTLNATLYAAIAEAEFGDGTPAATRDFILAAQQANGGWGFSGDPKGTEVDVDTTGLALQALVAARVDPYSTAARRAVAFLRANQLPSGGWEAFGEEDPNSTATAILGLTAAGRAVETCWPSAIASLAGRQAADGHVASPNDTYGASTFATSQAVQALGRKALPAVRAPAYCPDDGYRMVAADGGVFARGAPWFGSAAGLHLNRPVVGIAGRPGGQGYWLVAGDGGVFAYGDARFLGSTGAMTLTKPVVGIAATPSGSGYWLVGSDGGVFAYGDAPFLGSTGALTLNRPIVGMAVTPSGNGYWLVASDGGVFAYGDARFLGSTGALSLNRPIVGMAATPSGNGYWLVGADDGVFAYGDASFLGTPAATPGPVVGIRSGTRSDSFVTADAQGRAVTHGPGIEVVDPAPALNAPVVGIAG